jgi:thiol-disulfide isomerase/thioredoxin
MAGFLVAYASAGFVTSSDAGTSSRWIGKPAPEISQGAWINSNPLTMSRLRGKVVLLEFWTFGCYNCRNTLPYVKAWHKKFSDEEFTLIGVHSPEFEREKDLKNVKRQVASLGIEYPVVTDNEFETWNAYNQRYWPVIYLIDKRGIIRYVHIGEGAYDETERQIKLLIKEK